MKRKNGFTLVELLAVIVILAIILVIAVPQIMKTIDESREGAFSSSAKLVAASAEREYLARKTLDDTAFEGITEMDCKDVVEVSEDYEDCKITFDTNGKATVQLEGKGKFEGKYVCAGTRENVTIQENRCPSIILVVDANGGTNVETYNQKFEPGATLTLVVPTPPEGLVFDYWEVTGEGASVDGNILTIGTETTTVKAIWKELVAAKVGDTTYQTIDEAIANWEDGSTLTLLSDVTLTDVVQLNSTEHHILDLGRYTITAAEEKNAFEIIAAGTGITRASDALTINADSYEPGGINAGTKSVIYYKIANNDDRPKININGGVFTGSTSVVAGRGGIYTKGISGRNAPTLNISEGTFNCGISAEKTQLLISGGTFNYSIYGTGDTTAYRLISGGKFKGFTFMSADTSSKFTIGTSMSTFDVGLYVDNDGYLVVGGPVITEPGSKFEASATNATKWSTYLKHSSAAQYGLYYMNAEMAIDKHGEANVTIYTNTP